MPHVTNVGHWLVAPLHGALGDEGTVRLSDDLAAEIDRIAVANGRTRSSWIASALAHAAVAPENDELPVTPSGQGASRRSGAGDGPAQPQ